MDDRLILVDLFDRECGYAEKLEVHQKGWLHRAFSVFLINGSQMLIQKRAEHKYHSAGLWANTCCSHPRVDEELDSALRRRLTKKTGISCPTKEVFSFVYRTVFENSLVEYEFDHVFVGNYQGSFQANLEEASEMKWISFEQLADEMVTKPQIFAPWFIIAAPQVMKMV